ncbi:MAG: hypothetical protein K6F71_07670 [Ruminococcus sp.]|uniref:Uncharacterized protein n=1 Tax=Ruminococcus albus TaxID=1264 RepID=A0A1I1QLB4_RUMAL|nr:MULTISPECIES: hypothetical protein [Ruminococcus]MCR5540680.1 hypothetical protein [Ruminococcus sp.]SFD20638.1 hypothetical protein SAMN02910406_03381 [Ruminococcus albus]
MKHYYTIEITNIRFGNIRRVTILAESKEKAINSTVIAIGERIAAVWKL